MNKPGKGKGKARAEDSDEDQNDIEDLEEEIDDDEDDGEIKPQAPEMDEEQLDAQYGAAIRAQLENKKKVQGVSFSVAYIFVFPFSSSAQGIADHGIIEYVEMTQFMCHKFLRFTFGPQINFIIGTLFVLEYLYHEEFINLIQVTTEVGLPSHLRGPSADNVSIGGKSAVLSAITLALGGKTASTGRGTGIKSFIREGQK
jgi:hypothetical protein